MSSTYDAAAARVVFAVSDTGPGIPPSLRHRVFEPFFTTKAVGMGSGLGLSVCRGIVEAHGGSITVSDASAGGTCVEVARPVDAVIRGKRVLVVDDEPLVASLLVEILEHDGHRVDVVGNGRAALERLGAARFDAVISDDTVAPETRRFIESTGMPTLDKPFDADQVRRVVQDVLRGR